MKRRSFLKGAMVGAGVALIGVRTAKAAVQDGAGVEYIFQRGTRGNSSEAGVNGEDGLTQHMIFCASPTNPGTPPSGGPYPVPAGWHGEVPDSNEPIWASFSYFSRNGKDVIWHWHPPHLIRPRIYDVV